jgi:hypothetical protein
MKHKAAVLMPTTALLVVTLAGCQALFTTSPFSFLQRDPANLPPEQQVTWAEQALASGDPAAMAKAYAVIKNRPDQVYLAASLAAELSRVPKALADAIADMDNVTNMDQPALYNYLDGFLSSVDATYAGEAYTGFNTVLTTDPSQLTGTDMVMGALCLAFEIADANGGFSGANFASVVTFINSCLAVLPSGNPAEDLLNEVIKL